MCSHPASALCAVWEHGMDVKYAFMNTFKLIFTAFLPLGWKCHQWFRHFVFPHSLWWSRWSSLWNRCSKCKLVVEWTESSRTQTPWLLIACRQTAENSEWVWLLKVYSQFIHGLGVPSCLAEVQFLFCNELTKKKQSCLHT